MTHRPRHRTTLAFAGALLAAAIAVQGQDGPQPPQDDAYSFGDVIDVDLVNVEVWVTDPQGRPVSGLTADDFEIREDGKPVAITHFSELREPGAPATGLETLPPAPEAPPEAVAQEGGGDAHLVLYFDELHLGSLSRGQVIRDLRSFIASGGVAPERVMILRQEDDVGTEAVFGATREQLDAALERIGTASARSVQSEREKHLSLTRLSDLWDQARNLYASGGAANVYAVACPWFLRNAKVEVEMYAKAARIRTATTLDNLTTVSSLLAGVPGVKTLVYVADTLDVKPGLDLMAFVDGFCPPASRNDTITFHTEEMSEPFRRFTRHANANRVTFYTLQAFGLRPSTLYGADQTANALAPKFLDTRMRASAREGLTVLAGQTGGRAIFNRNEFGGELEQIAREMASYYWLAYTPPHGGDGLEHRIDVKVRDAPPLASADARTKLRVRHRLGYRDKSPDERMSEHLQSALYLGEVSNPLAARIGSGEIRDTGKGRFTLPFHVMIPVDSIAFLPQSGGDFARIKVQVAIRNGKSGKVDVQEKLFRVVRPPAGSAQLVDLVVELELRPGVHVLAVGVRDEATREISYLATAVQLQDAEAASG
jgi:VWFA-related protein